jgi:hypothetical protein
MRSSSPTAPGSSFWKLVVGIAFVVPFLYFLSRAEDRGFLDGAMGNWFATVVGVAVGIPVGLEVSRRQQAKAEESARADRLQEGRKRFREVLSSVVLELQGNKARLERLAEVLRMASSSRMDLWEAAAAVTGSLSLHGAQLLDQTPDAYFYLRGHLLVPTSYNSVRQVIAKVAEGKALHMLYLGYSGNQDAADAFLQEAIETVEVVWGVVSEAIESGDKLLDTFADVA